MKTQSLSRFWFRHSILSVVLWMIGTSALTAAEKDNKLTVVPRLKAELNLDGRLSEAVWSQARVLGPFVQNDDGLPATDQTYVRLFFDDKALYLGWSIYDSDIQATLRSRDSRFWEEEVVEFFLSTENLDRYFELQWNPLGGVFDAIIRNSLDAAGRSKKIDGDWDFTASKMRSKVFVDGTVGNRRDSDRVWTVEVMIPFSDLGVNEPPEGVDWRANFYRFNRGGKVKLEKLAWNPTRDASFHQPSRFGVLRFQSNK